MVGRTKAKVGDWLSFGYYGLGLARIVGEDRRGKVVFIRVGGHGSTSQSTVTMSRARLASWKARRLGAKEARAAEVRMICDAL